MSKMLHTIAYTSESLIAGDDLSLEIQAIVDVAQAMNKSREITGILMFMNNRFMQIIEGREEDLRALMRNIEADKRHRNIEYLADLPVKKRGFENWSMEFFDLDDPRKFSLENLCQIRDGLQENVLTSSREILGFYNSILQ